MFNDKNFSGSRSAALQHFQYSFAQICRAGSYRTTNESAGGTGPTTLSMNTNS